MGVDAPATVGTLLRDVDTPALLVDLDVFESNLKRMATDVSALSIDLRPHAKTHKSADIAKAQIASGAVGVCCQKVSEAEALVEAGISDILITNEVVGTRKIDRLVALSKRAKIVACVDNVANVEALENAAGYLGQTLDLLVEVNVGSSRCGVDPKTAVALAQRISESPHLRFSGLQAYHGGAQHIREFAERREAIASASAVVSDVVNQLQIAGIQCQRVTGAGTGTWQFEATSGVYTELQAGSYIFMDADYARNRHEPIEQPGNFGHSLFVYATVMSTPEPGRVVVDAGLKSMAFDAGMPLVVDDLATQYERPSDEHGNLILSKASMAYELGDKLKLIPGHCDPTVNLHDWYVCVRGDVVEAIWPVTCRGALF